MPIKALREVIFLKIEATYNTDPVPVAATDSILAHNFSCTPLELVYAERMNALPFFGNQGQIKAGDMVKMEFDIECAGAGAVAGTPGFGAALKGCALSETLTPTTGPMTYAPISTAEQSVTVYFNWDGLMHKMTGARGTTSLKLAKGGIPMIHFAFTGLYGSITDVALGVPVLTAFQKPLNVNKANTTFTLHGFAGVLADLSFDQGNTINYVNLPNSEEVRFVDRKSRGSVTIELPLIAAKDFFTIIRAETAGVLALVQGTTAGNKFKLDAANVQLTNPKYSEADGAAMLQMGMEFLPSSAGNDEFTYKTI